MTCKVLIVDDELPAREAIRILGEWERLGITDIREADNGEAALAIVEAWQPDVVLVDMKMPVMDGAALLRRMEELSPGVFTIVISGFDDFEFTRQAIQSKVVDYLLKPVIRGELNQALAKAIDYLEARRKRANEAIDRDIALNMSLPKLKETIYLSMVDRTLQEQTKASSLKLIGADEPGVRFCAAALRILNLDEIKNGKFGGDGTLFRYALTNVINELGESGVRCFSFANPKQERELIVVMQGHHSSADISRQRELSFLRQVCSKLNEMFGVLLLAGIGDVAEDAADVGDSYDAAVNRLLAIDLLEWRGSMTVAAEDSGNAGAPPDIPSITARIPAIRTAMQNHNSQVMRGIAADYIGAIRKCGVFSFRDACRTLDEMDFILKDIAAEMGVPTAELTADAERLTFRGASRDIRSFEQFAHLLSNGFEHYGEMIRQHARLNSAFDIRDIKDYIDQHYYEEVKIATFTEMHYLSREYLMKLFKQAYGTGIYEYVLKVRMDKAKQLLRDPDLRIQHIADILGYKDKNYFSKAFKNYCGVSPSDYRHEAEQRE